LIWDRVLVAGLATGRERRDRLRVLLGGELRFEGVVTREPARRRSPADVEGGDEGEPAAKTTTTTAATATKSMTWLRLEGP
jgi:hypothetical protein